MSRVKIPVNNFRERLKLIGNEIHSFNTRKTGEEDVPVELAEMKREIDEKKLLQYQLRVKKGNVNEFLKAKYSDGNFNAAELNGYDNSQQRLNNAITYEYHVFFNKLYKSNGDDFYADLRPPQEWVISKPLVDKVGDTYFYHIPIRQHITPANEQEYVTDYGEELSLQGIPKKNDGIVYALNVLHQKQQDGVNGFDRNVINILRQNGFLNKENQIKFDLKGKLVEKYLKGIMPEKQKQAMEYLNEEFSQENRKEYEKTIVEPTEFSANTQIEIATNLKTFQDMMKKSLNNVKLNDYKQEVMQTKNKETMEEIKKKFTELYEQIDGNKVKGFDDLLNEFAKYVDDKISSYEDAYEEVKRNIEKIHNDYLKTFNIDAVIDYNYDIDDETEYKQWLKKEVVKWKKEEERKKEEEEERKKEEEEERKKKEEERRAKEYEVNDKDYGAKLTTRLKILKASLLSLKYNNEGIEKEIEALFRSYFVHPTLSKMKNNIASASNKKRIKAIIKAIGQTNINRKALDILKVLESSQIDYNKLIGYPEDDFNIAPKEVVKPEVVEEKKEDVKPEVVVEVAKDNNESDDDEGTPTYTIDNNKFYKIIGSIETKYHQKVSNKIDVEGSKPELIFNITKKGENKFEFKSMTIKYYYPKTHKKTDELIKEIKEINESNLNRAIDGNGIIMPRYFEQYFYDNYKLKSNVTFT